MDDQELLALVEQVRELTFRVTHLEEHLKASEGLGMLHGCEGCKNWRLYGVIAP